MEKSGKKLTDKKLTDRELIDSVVAWYEDRLSLDELRAAVDVYVQPMIARDLKEISLDSEDQTDDFIEPVDADSQTSNSDLEDKKFESYEVVPYQQFEPTDEAIGGGGWMIDVWALYYGVEDFFHRISFGIVTMQTIAILFCMLISAAVMIGAWQSSLSSERLKKATYKTIEIDPDAKNGNLYTFPELISTPQETNSLVPTDEEIEATSNSAQTPIMLKSSSLESETSEFSVALDFLEKAAWDEALAELKTLENVSTKDLQPMLSLLRIEALIRKQDRQSMEFARQLLMDCEIGEYELVFELLVARWMLLGSAENRTRFLNERASLPLSVRQRMSTWASVRNGSKDALTEEALKSNASKGQGAVCDLLFLASFHFSLGRTDETVRELLETQYQLRNLHVSGKSRIESWLLETARGQLETKVDEILTMVSQKPSKQIN